MPKGNNPLTHTYRKISRDLNFNKAYETRRVLKTTYVREVISGGRGLLLAGRQITKNGDFDPDCPQWLNIHCCFVPAAVEGYKKIELRIND